MDHIFTDPPFGDNINYSEMNYLWEAWLGAFTQTRDEAIINRVQRKTIDDYRELMTRALSEMHRVLKPKQRMIRPKTRPAFSKGEFEKAHALLASRVATMRKYSRLKTAKGKPSPWSWRGLS